MTKYSKKNCKITKNKTKQTKHGRYKRKNSMRNNRLYGGGEIRTLEFNIEGFDFILTKQLFWPFGIGGNAADYKLELVHTNKTTSEYINECNLPEFIKQLKNNIMVMIGLYNHLYSISTKPPFYFNSLLKELHKTKEYAAQIVLNLRTESETHTVPNIRKDFDLSLRLPDNTQFNNVSAILTGDTFCIAITHIFTTTNPNDRIKQIVYKYCKEILKALLLSNLLDIYRHFEISKINPELPILFATGPKELRKEEQLKHPPVEKTLDKTVYNVVDNLGRKNELTVITGCKSFTEGSIVMRREVAGYSMISSLSTSPTQICIDNATNVFCNLESAYYDCNTHNIYVLIESCGTNLHEIILNENGALSQLNTTAPIPLLYIWLKPIAIGIKCMQTRNLIHHDIKPANIYINIDTNNSKLNGFKFINPVAYNKPAPTNADKMACVYTRPQILLNTAKKSDWMLCDIYSLGITFIECAFALHYPVEYKTLLGNELLYSIFRHTDNNQIPTETTEIKLDDIGYVLVPGEWNNSLLIHKTDYNLDDVIPHTNFTVRGIYNAVAKLKTNYPLCMEMIGDKIRDIDMIISKFDTLTTTS